MKPEILLIRHGEAAATWREHRDPGLSELGQQQATAVVEALADMAPAEILTSPLQRAQETAAPLAAAWGRQPVVDERFREIPSTVSMMMRQSWLQDIMQSNWIDIDDEALLTWRTAAHDALRARTESVVVFTHYMVINAMAGIATKDDRTVTFRPENGSITRLSVESRALVLVARGTERETDVL